MKQKDGSFDLTPLFIGSQGSLGVICEVIMKAQFIRPEYSVVAASYKKLSDAQSAVELAMKNKASAVEIIDGRSSVKWLSGRRKNALRVRWFWLSLTTFLTERAIKPRRN